MPDVHLRPSMPDLIVSVDFGMTATGVVYFYQDKQWRPPAKIPSALLYQKQEDGTDKLMAWGDEAEVADVADVEVYSTPASTSTPVSRGSKREWFKILLHTGYLELYQTREKILHREVRRWITDYLTCLYTWIKVDISIRLSLEDWSELQVAFAFAVPDRWSLEDRVALGDYNACIKDAGFLNGGAGHRMLMQTEATAAASYFEQNEVGIHWMDRQKVLVIDAGGSTIDVAICLARIFNSVPRFTSTRVLGSITGVCGANWLMRLENCIERKVFQERETTKIRVPWSKLQPFVRKELRKATGIPNLLQDTVPDYPVLLRTMGSSIDHVSAAGTEANEITLSSQEIGNCATLLMDEIANKLRQTVEKNGRAELAHISQVVVAGGFGSSPLFMSAVRQWKGSSANPFIRSAAITQSKDPRMEVAIGLVHLVRNWFNFVDCKLVLEDGKDGSDELVTVQGGPQYFEKRVKCGSDSVFTINCKRSIRSDVLGNLLSTDYKLEGVEISIAKTPMFGKGTKLRGVASADGADLSWRL